MSQHCPLCAAKVQPNERYPRYVCDRCAACASAPDGRLLCFSNTGMSGGYSARYADDDTPYPSHDCQIRGIACHAQEARFGGIVIQVLP